MSEHEENELEVPPAEMAAQATAIMPVLRSSSVAASTQSDRQRVGAVEAVKASVGLISVGFRIEEPIR